MKNKEDIYFFTNIDIEEENDNVAIPPEIEDKMRAFANRLVDIMLEDIRKNRLNFVIKNNTILIGQKRYNIKYLD